MDTILNKQKGFTLWEIIIVLSIMVILARIGIPAMANITQLRRSEVAAISIVDSFRYARSEAIRRNLPVYVCGLKLTSNETLYDCTNTPEWSSGTLSFVDYSNLGLYRGNEKTLVKMTKLDKNSSSTVQITAPFPVFKVDARSVISIMTKPEQKTFCFDISQRINGKQINTKLKIDSYGNYTYCKPEELDKCTCI